MNKYRTLIIALVVVISAVLGYGAWLHIQASPQKAGSLVSPVSTVSKEVTHIYTNTYSSPYEFMAGIYGADKTITPPAEDRRIRGVIIPHHLTASVSIASGVKMLSHQSFKKIVLISPDHFYHCKTALCITNAKYETYFGDVSADPTIVATLTASPLVSDNPDLFTTEHGIYADVPFIAHYFPGIPVTPIAFSTKNGWKVQKDAIKDLIAKVVDDDTILIISSDFSHYLPLKTAQEMDAKSLVALMSGDLAGIASLNDADESDCPGCLWTLASLAADRGFNHPEVVMHTNSATILHQENIPSTTSHFSMVWYEK